MTAPAMLRSRPLTLVLTGGLVAGGLDILYAFVFWWIKAGVAPGRILQAVAAGLLGRASFQGGTPTVVLGLFLQFFIATTMSFTYYLVARVRPLLVERPVWCGLGYGLILYGVMNYVVVPLSAAARGSRDPVWVTLTILVHMVLIGLPIALFSRRALATN